MNHPDDKSPVEGEDKTKLKKQIKFAVIVAVLVLFTYGGLAVVAANLMVKKENNRKGFKSVQVEQPISFIDKTYVVDKESDNQQPIDDKAAESQ